MRSLALAALLLVLPLPAFAGGAAATAEPDATRIALEILDAGGSAADAAVAAALALAVAHPQAGNLAGGGFAVIRHDGEVFALDFRETAPAAAHREMYLDAEGGPRPGASTVGPLSTGVPGTPHGLFELHRRFGVLPWRRVVRPAASLAERGFVVRPRLEDSLSKRVDELSAFSETAEAWLPGGAPVAAGARVRLPALARTLRSYARKGPAALTEGRVAEALVAASERHGGVLTLADLAGYEARWREPIRFRVPRTDWSVASMPLPSSGGLLLAQSFYRLDSFERVPSPPGRSPAAAEAHRLAETWRRAYADRFAMGDPDTGESATPEDLLDPGWMQHAVRTFEARRATPSETVHPFEAPERVEPAETTHLSVIDGDGNAVSLTTTLNWTFGSRLWVPEVGFLNNEMDDFATAPGRPNAYGLIQGPANEVRPGARMLSSMSPTIAWRGDEVLALGSPGGSRIPTAVFQVLRRVVRGEALQDAVDAARIHHQWRPDRVDHEPGALDAAARAELEAMGHLLNERARHGEVHAVRRRASERFVAAADPRGPGVAAARND